MQIRTLKWRGLSMWPPEWTIMDQGLGEAGVLEEVHLRKDLNPKLISVVANHLGEVRKGIMVLEDPALLEVRLRQAQTACRPAAHRNRRFGDQFFAPDAEARPQASSPPLPFPP